MRESKFRCWDGKKMVWDGKPFYIIGETTMFDLLKQYPIADYNDLVLMQFTGLLDKSGKEIYEGDVVRHHDYSSGACLTMPQYTRDSVIEWDDSRPGYSLPGLGWQIDGKKCEVVGNVYENPELVSGKEKDGNDLDK